MKATINRRKALGGNGCVFNVMWRKKIMTFGWRISGCLAAGRRTG